MNTLRELARFGSVVEEFSGLDDEIMMIEGAALSGLDGNVIASITDFPSASGEYYISGLHAVEADLAAPPPPARRQRRVPPPPPRKVQATHVIAPAVAKAAAKVGEIANARSNMVANYAKEFAKHRADAIAHAHKGRVFEARVSAQKAIRAAKGHAVVGILARNARAQETIGKAAALAAQQGKTKEFDTLRTAYRSVGAMSERIETVRHAQVTQWKGKSADESVELAQVRIQRVQKAIAVLVSASATRPLSPDEAHLLDQAREVEKKLRAGINAAKGVGPITTPAVEATLPHAPVFSHGLAPQKYIPGNYGTSFYGVGIGFADLGISAASLYGDAKKIAATIDTGARAVQKATKTVVQTGCKYLARNRAVVDAATAVTGTSKANHLAQAACGARKDGGAVDSEQAAHAIASESGGVVGGAKTWLVGGAAAIALVLLI